MHLARRAAPASSIGNDLRAVLTALGRGDGALGGAALYGVALAGLSITIDVVLVLPRGVLVISGVDLPGPAVRLDAPIVGPWLVDGWRLVRPDGNPTGSALAAASAVAARLEAPGAPDLPVTAVIAVGPYVGTVHQPPDDLARGLTVLHPTTKALWRLANDRANAPRPCTVAAASRLITLLAPDTVVDDAVLAAEGFTATEAERM